MYLTGFADEAGTGIDAQIEATGKLGWRNIESRNIDGRNIHDIPDAAFDAVCGKLREAGIQINCFGSTIANWGKSIEEPITSSLEETRRAIPRMQRLGTKLVRIMSFAMRKGRGPEDQMVDERVRRLRELVPMLLDAGITPVHENCMNYGGMGWRYTLELIEKVPGMQLVFDTGNPVFTPDYAKGRPYPRQSAWDFYEHVRDFVEYVHIKDGRFVADNPDGIFPKADFTWPGEGDGDVEKIMTDLLARGYDGGISIEPHLAAVYHEESGESEEQARMRSYIEYGRRLEAMIAAIRKALS